MDYLDKHACEYSCHATEQLNFWTQKAKAGDPIAQRRLSFLYQGAKGFPEEPIKAFNRDGPCVGDRAREAVKLRHDTYVACAHGGEGLGKTGPVAVRTRQTVVCVDAVFGDPKLCSRICHAGVGGLVQQSPPSRTHRKHPASRGRSQLLRSSGK